MENEKIELSIGFPIYNGEKFLKNRLESILSQSFRKFELIISDNNSNDNTQKICKEFLEKDSRIKYIKQEKNIEAKNNFKFVLSESIGKYFVWAAVDDIWEIEFLEKNIDFLEKNEKFVASISKVTRFGGDSKRFEDEGQNIKKYYNKFRKKFRKFGVWTTKGNYLEKAQLYLRSSSAQAVYSIFRRKELEKSFCEQIMSSWDMIIILNILKFGDINVIDDELIHFGWEGTSKEKISDPKKLISKIGFKTYFFPQLDFAKWCLDSLGMKFFLKNLDHFMLVNFWALIISLKAFFVSK